MGVYIGTNCMKSDLSIWIKSGMFVPFNLIIPPFEVYLTRVLKYVKMMHLNDIYCCSVYSRKDSKPSNIHWLKFI